MGDSDENLLKFIRHYQSSLDKHTEKRNDAKLFHYIDRLYKLPIKVHHLEQTGVGRTVNGLRKLGGKVGDSAKRLVNKWKSMVVGEQDSDEQDDEEEDDEDEGGGENNEDDGYSEEHVESANSQSSDEEERDSDRAVAKKSHDNSPRHSSHRVKAEEKHEKSRHSSGSSSRNGNSDRHKKEKHHKRHKHDNGEGKSHKRRHSTSEDDSDNGHSEEEELPKHRKKEKKDSSDDEMERHKSSERHKSKRRVDSDDSGDDNDDDDEDEYEKPKDKKREKSRDSSEPGNKKHKSKNKSRDECEEPEKKGKHSSKERHKSEGGKDKNRKDDSSRKHEHKKTKEQDKKEKSKESGSKSRSSSSSKTTESKSKATPKKPPGNNYGIDSGSGASFAEALGMCEPSSSKGSNKKKSSVNLEVLVKPPKEKLPKSPKIDEYIPKLLKEVASPEPLDINISSLLPSITPNYRPLGLPLAEPQAKKFMNDYEALTHIITAKNQRTKVYSGNKTMYGKVPTLFELCIRVLQDNIDALEYTGGVPYSILKPILDKATPNQLFSMEHHNPYLIDDTDELWQMHCQKDFRNKKREELESWREMYMRCLDEREAKLKALTANIKQAQDKSLPVRTTKLAYVNDVAKPPRNIARKQAKNGVGFEKRPAMTPSARLSTIATSGEAGKVAVPNPGARAVERSSGHSVVKPKKAPLMAKTLSFLKNQYRR